MSRILFLIDPNNNKIRIDTTLKFGRSTPGYHSITAHVSRIHFEIEPLPIKDYRSNSGQNCAMITLKGRYLRISSLSNNKSKEYRKKNEIIFIKHNDKINLVATKFPSDQYTLTVSDPLKSRKRKRDSLSSLNSNDSNPSSPSPKRCKLNNDSMHFNYANMNISNIESIQNETTPSPQRHVSNPMSLSGLMTSNFDASPSHNIKSSPSPSISSKYSAFASFPMDDDDADDDNMQNAEIPISKESKSEVIDSDDSEYLDHLLNDESKKNEQKNEEAKIENLESLQKENDEKQRRFEEGKYSLAVPIIDCDKYHFSTDRVLCIIARVLSEFMRIHRHPKLRIVVIATHKFCKSFYKMLLNEYKNEKNEDSMSLDLECDENEYENYKMFECDERILIFDGAYSDIVCLRERGLCCQYLTNFVFWSFDKKKGDKLNKIINKACIHLSDSSIKKYKTAKKKCTVYSVELNETNGGSLYFEQNVRSVLQIRMPSLNECMQDYVANAENAYIGLSEAYSRIFAAFYQGTNLTMPAKDELIIKDVSNWNNAKLIKQEHDKECDKDKDNFLHFSLQKVPVYDCPNSSDWPSKNGKNWKNALLVYIEDEKKRENKWQRFIFYEDLDFVVIYDKYYKAKYHLMIMPKFEIRSVYELDPMNSSHIAMMEGLLARSKWIETGLMKRHREINKMKCGFHAIPSMNQVHLHLLSDDMDSPNLKNKKHFHSFTSPYFIPGKVMLRILKEEKRKFKIDKKYYESLLKQKLKCHFCFCEIRTIPKLKEHIKRCKFGKQRNAEKNTFSFGKNDIATSAIDDQYDDFKVVFD